MMGAVYDPYSLLAQQVYMEGPANPPGRLWTSRARETIKQIVRMVLNSVAAHVPSNLRVVRKDQNPG
jgi:hypothetical protein